MGGISTPAGRKMVWGRLGGTGVSQKKYGALPGCLLRGTVVGFGGRGNFIQYNVSGGL